MLYTESPAGLQISFPCTFTAFSGFGLFLCLRKRMQSHVAHAGKNT